ncbi:MAG: helix-turn-helix transcriptional regulator [Alphaproteobacteria bacterium]
MIATKRQLERGRNIDGSSNDIDRYVGEQLRMRREMLKMSQTDVGDFLGVSFQQIQKYERGANRISPARLYDVASILGIEISDIFPPINPLCEDVMKEPQVMKLVYFFKKIESSRVANKFVEILKSMSEKQ